VAERVPLAQVAEEAGVFPTTVLILKGCAHRMWGNCSRPVRSNRWSTAVLRGVMPEPY
jgi:hypothetical protein